MRDPTPSTSTWDRREWGWLLAAVLLAGAAVRTHQALTDDGMHWPDEVYQSLEPAHRAVYGYGMQAWEMIQGARHWALPGLVAALLWMAKLFGLTAPREYLTVVRLAFCGLGVGTAAATWLLARRHGATRASATFAASALALGSVPLYLGPRAMSDTACALPLTLGLALALPREAPRLQRLLGCSLLGVAVMLRLQSAVFCIAVLAVLLVRRRRQEALECAAVFLVWAALFGAVDWLTWGLPFQSAWVYFRFNVLEGKIGNFGRQPFPFYALRLVTALGPLAVALVALAAVAARRTATLFVSAGVLLLIYSSITHKELRFIYPLLPLWAAGAAVGLDAVARWRPRAGMAFAVLCFALVAASAASYPSLTFERLGLGQYYTDVSAFDWGGSENRLLIAASAREDLCGLRVSTRAVWQTGGLSHLHRAARLYGDTSESPSHYNYVIAPEGLPGEEVARDGDLRLVKVAPGCQPDPAYSFTLP